MPIKNENENEENKNDQINEEICTPNRISRRKPRRLQIERIGRKGRSRKI